MRTAIGAATLLIASPLALHSAAAYAGLTTLVGAVVTGWVAERGRGFEAGAGVVYAGVMTVGANLLRASPEYGLAATLWLFAVVWGTDVMAYMGGRLIGGPKLWRRVSPGKTWSGAVIGALASAPIGAAVAALASPTPVRLLAMALMGLIVSVAAQAGDLFELALKRRAGVKDFEQPDSGARRGDGSAGRFRRRRSSHRRDRLCSRQRPMDRRRHFSVVIPRIHGAG